MASVLVVFSHPAFQKSKVNKRLLQAIKDIPGVTIHDLYELYPDFHIDVEYEQQLIADHDVIIFQHPFYWYSMPALLKEWMDLVFEFGFAYGRGGDKLKGKLLMSTITAGGSDATYRASGEKEITREKLLFAFQKMSELCQLTYLPPFVIMGTHSLDNKALDALSEAYRSVVDYLVRYKTDLKKMTDYTTMNDFILALKEV